MIAQLLRAFGLQPIKELTMFDLQQQRKAQEQRHTWYENFLAERRRIAKTYAEHEVPAGE